MGCKELDITSYYRLTEPHKTPQSTENFCTPENPYSRFFPVVSVLVPNYRYYSPELGRWLSRDPIGETGSIPWFQNNKNRILYTKIIDNINKLDKYLYTLSLYNSYWVADEAHGIRLQLEQIKLDLNNAVRTGILTVDFANAYLLLMNRVVNEIDLLGLDDKNKECPPVPTSTDVGSQGDYISMLLEMLKYLNPVATLAARIRTLYKLATNALCQKPKPSAPPISDDEWDKIIKEFEEATDGLQDWHPDDDDKPRKKNDF